jgi:hypothetical protein
MHTICAGEGLQNAVRRHHGDEKGKKADALPQKKSGLLSHARPLDKGAAAPRQQADNTGKSLEARENRSLKAQINLPRLFF